MIAPVDGELLRSVSRSFFLSLRILPSALREPVSLAYLLARTTDTIADTRKIDVAVRIQMLDAFASAIQGEAGEVIAVMREKFAPLQENDAERRLIVSAAACLWQLSECAPNDRAEIRALLAIIVRGQRLDLTRWDHGFAALRNAEELREYTYLVAGCVGEFWTRLCFRKLPRFSKRPEVEMSALGKKYGCGLQLVNILRDAGADLDAGRCYFPADELRAAGIAPSDLALAPPQFAPLFQQWVDEAKRGLDAGMEYSLAVDNTRVRIATALPALIGMRTLRLLEQSGLSAIRARVKVPRSEVRGMIWSLAITLAARGRLRDAYDELRK